MKKFEHYLKSLSAERGRTNKMILGLTLLFVIESKTNRLIRL